MNAANQYDRSKVVQIVNSVISKMDGASTDSVKKLAGELQSLVNAIESTRAELAATGARKVGSEDVPTAMDELDAVVDATKTATDDIMNACDAISAAASGAPNEAAVLDEVTKIYEACSFQDITGQRIKKVVTVLREVEGKVGHMLKLLGHVEGDGHQLAVKPDNREGDDKLMNGPQLAANAMSQEEIDKLLASFD